MKSILFVDSTNSRTLTLEEICRGLEFEITTVNNSVDAINSMNGKVFDILITESELEICKFIITQDNPVKVIVIHDSNVESIARFKKKFTWSNITNIKTIYQPFDSGQDGMFGQMIRSLIS